MTPVLENKEPVPSAKPTQRSRFVAFVICMAAYAVAWWILAEYGSTKMHIIVSGSLAYVGVTTSLVLIFKPHLK